MKKLFSKRSGFSLAEILVAFMIFAIMAGMIMMILRMAIAQRSSNQQFADELVVQEEKLVKNDKITDFTLNPTDAVAGTLEFDFTNGSTVSFDIDYKMYSADNTTGDAAYDGLNYFVADVDYDHSGSHDPVDDPSNPSRNTGTQASRMDTRLTGTGGLNKITFWKIIKDDTDTDGDGVVDGLTGTQVRYFIECSADGSTMASEDVPYAQYRMYFYYKNDYNDIDVKNEAGDVIGTKRVYKAAPIVELGYVNSTNLDTYNYSTATAKRYQLGDRMNDTINPYKIELTGSNGVRIGTPWIKDRALDTGNFTRMYVVFEKDPVLDVTCFGNNATDGVTIAGVTFPNARSYSVYPVLDDDNNPTADNHVNIYGAFPYVVTPVTP